MERNSELYILLLLCIWLLHIKCGSQARAQDLTSKAQAVAHGPVEARPTGNGAGLFAAEVPEFTLNDPLGAAQKSCDLYKTSGMLIMITVPSLSQYERQVRWQKHMDAQKWPAENAPRQVVLEDLSQQTMFKERARSMMKQKYLPTGKVTVLIDEDGAVRRGFGVQENETVVLLINADGEVIHHENSEEMPDAASARRLMKHVTNLAQANAKRRVPVSTPTANTAPTPGTAPLVVKPAISAAPAKTTPVLSTAKPMTEMAAKAAPAPVAAKPAAELPVAKPESEFAFGLSVPSHQPVRYCATEPAKFTDVEGSLRSALIPIESAPLEKQESAFAKAADDTGTREMPKRGSGWRHLRAIMVP